MLSFFLIILSGFPIQSVAENLQVMKAVSIRNMRLTNIEGNPLSKEVEPDTSFVSQFDLTIAENEQDMLFELPTEIMTSDKELYRKVNVAISIENNQLRVVNDSDQQSSIEGVTFEFKLVDYLRSQL